MLHKVLPATMLATHEASNCLTLLLWFMKADIAISWFESLEYTTNAFQYRIVSFKGFFHSSLVIKAFVVITLCWPSTI